MADLVRAHRVGALRHLAIWAQPPRAAMALDHLGQRFCRHRVARRLRPLLLVRREFRQLQQDLRLARRDHRLHDLDVAVNHLVLVGAKLNAELERRAAPTSPPPNPGPKLNGSVQFAYVAPSMLWPSAAQDLRRDAQGQAEMVRICILAKGASRPRSKLSLWRLSLCGFATRKMAGVVIPPRPFLCS